MFGREGLLSVSSITSSAPFATPTAPVFFLLTRRVVFALSFSLRSCRSGSESSTVVSLLACEPQLWLREKEGWENARVMWLRFVPVTPTVAVFIGEKGCGKGTGK